MQPGDVATLVVLLAGAGLFIAELRAPARRFEDVSGWKAKGGLFFVLLLVIGGGVPALLQPWLAPFRLLDGAKLGIAGGAVAGVLAADLVSYWMHRGYHRFDFGWRFFHQLHHSAERVNLPGYGYAHPSENVLNAAVSTVVMNLVLGLSAGASGVAGAVMLFLGLLQHSNVRTPAWLGYLIQRPEQHCVHHQRGAHALNYASLPLYDLLFGTFRNPAEWQGEAGFHAGASKQLAAMLAGHDISNAQAARTLEVEQNNRA